MDKPPVKRYTDFKTLAQKHPRVNMEAPRKYKHWTCGGCNKLLGLIYSDGVLAVKYKDLLGFDIKPPMYVWIAGRASAMHK